MKTITGCWSETFAKSLTLILALVLISTVSSGQQNIRNEESKNSEDNWWIPIVEKHKLELKASNTFSNIFEMGTTNKIDNGVCTLTDAVVILRNDSGRYTIIESPFLTHDYSNELLIAKEGTIKVFRKDSDVDKPITIMQIQKMEIKFPRN